LAQKRDRKEPNSSGKPREKYEPEKREGGKQKSTSFDAKYRRPKSNQRKEEIKSGGRTKEERESISRCKREGRKGNDRVPKKGHSPDEPLKKDSHGKSRD